MAVSTVHVSLTTSPALQSSTTLLSHSPCHHSQAKHAGQIQGGHLRRRRDWRRARRLLGRGRRGSRRLCRPRRRRRCHVCGRGGGRVIRRRGCCRIRGTGSSGRRRRGGWCRWGGGRGRCWGVRLRHGRCLYGAPAIRHTYPVRFAASRYRHAPLCQPRLCKLQQQTGNAQGAGSWESGMAGISGRVLGASV